MKISVVVPVYNEQGNVAKLHGEIVRSITSVTSDYEIIFVNDCSSDKTLTELEELSPITIIDLGRNTGQSAALKAGFDHATGDLVVSLDGDGQNDPAEIPKMIAYMEENDLDVVSGWRKNRKDRLMKKIVSRFGVKLHHLLINDGVHDSGCTLKVYKTRYVKDLELFGELHRYLPAILQLRGARVGEMVVHHRARTIGKSKYGPGKIIKGLMDLGLVWFWQKYASRPVHLFGGLSALTILFGIGTGLFAAWMKWGPWHRDLSETFLPNIAFFAVMIGIQLFVTGILADIVIKHYYKDQKPYYVREVITHGKK